MGLVCRRPPFVKSTPYAGTRKPKTASKSLILSQRDNAQARNASLIGDGHYIIDFDRLSRAELSRSVAGF